MFEPPTRIRPGDTAPGFELPAQDGSTVSLDDLLADGPVVLFFYVRDGTPGCTRQACGFRDVHEELSEAGATVVGISSDPVEDHATFAAEHDLPYLLLSDADDRVRDRYEVSDTLGLLPGRVTFVVDADGVVRHVTASQLRPGRHVREAVEALRGQP